MNYLIALEAYEPVVVAFAKRHGGHVESSISQPATAVEIAVAEAELHYDLPPMYRSFLAECNGFKSSIYGPNGCCAYTIDIYGTGRLVEEREKLEAFREEHVDVVDYDKFSKLLLFSGRQDAYYRHFFWRSNPGQWQIVVRDYISGEFLDDRRLPIAQTFDEYFIKTLDAMKNGSGCYYYEDVRLVEDLREY